MSDSYTLIFQSERGNAVCPYLHNGQTLWERTPQGRRHWHSSSEDTFSPLHRLQPRRTLTWSYRFRLPWSRPERPHYLPPDALFSRPPSPPLRSGHQQRWRRTERLAESGWSCISLPFSFNRLQYSQICPWRSSLFTAEETIQTDCPKEGLRSFFGRVLWRKGALSWLVALPCVCPRSPVSPTPVRRFPGALCRCCCSTQGGSDAEKGGARVWKQGALDKVHSACWVCGRRTITQTANSPLQFPLLVLQWNQKPGCHPCLKACLSLVFLE